MGIVASRRALMGRAAVLAAAVFTLFAAPGPGARAQPGDQGLEWVTIGQPGNRGILPSEVFLVYRGPRGAVNYEYRMTQTEITAGQWLEFVRAYQPYYTGNPLDTAFVGEWIRYDDRTRQYTLASGAVDWPNTMDWRMAARYCNWLHNDKALTRDAFESGAYDTSTFTPNPAGGFNDQVTRSPDARYWIPDADEWIKGAYYDPNRYGDAQEGYWMYPYASNSPPIPGAPEDGATTNAGVGGPGPGFFERFSVYTYPNANAPWGLLGVSGGVREWTEEPYFDFGGVCCRLTGGSEYGGEFDLSDRNEGIFFSGSSPLSTVFGFRIASSVPEAHAALSLIALLSHGLMRRRR